MKIAPAQCAAFLKTPPKGLSGVVIYGKDRSRVGSEALLFAKHLVSNINDPFQVSLLNDQDIEQDPLKIDDALSAQSLMGGQRLVRVRFYSEKAQTDKVLATLLKAHDEGGFNPESFLILEAGNLGATSSLRRVADSAKKIASIALYDEETQDLRRVLSATLSAENVSMSPQAMDIFLARLPKDYGVARSEIERVVLYIGPGSGKKIDEGELLTILGVEADASFSQAALDAFGGRARLAQSGLRRAFSEGESPVTALFAWNAHFQKLMNFKIRCDEGDMAKDAAKAAQIFWKDQSEFQRQAKQWRYEALASLNSDLFHADIQCKTTGLPSHLIVERFFLRTAETARRHNL